MYSEYRKLTKMAGSEKGVASVHTDIVKSAEDKRDYRGLVLDNGMKVLLVSDPTTDKSSAALDVHVGHMMDPTYLPGLAHFCEHMLFLGTDKYPEENEYSKYLSEHGGRSNAFTCCVHTLFYFDVGPDYLSGALDRFAQFFLGPLFTESATSREIKAVNSENENSMKEDSWRILLLKRSSSREGHDFKKFDCGDTNTLDVIPKEKGINVRDELLKFHDKNYSSNIMGLTILGKESLDDLNAMVMALFPGVKNKNLSIKEWEEHAYGPDQLQKYYHIVPVKDIRSLTIVWPIPDLNPHYKSSPGDYLSHLIGHEGQGSLLSLLKSKGWCTTLSGGAENGANGFMFFEVKVDLSEDGLEHSDDIVLMVFQYLTMLRQQGPQEWIFKECQELTAMKFRFKDKEVPSSYTVSCAGLLHRYPMQDVLTGGNTLVEYRPDLIKSVLENLSADKCRVQLVGQKFTGKTDLQEEWYKTDYAVIDISEATLASWRNAGLNDKLAMPKPNEFIPGTFDLVEGKDEAALPFVIHDTDMSRVWYKKDDTYLLPKSYLTVEMISPFAYSDPLSEVLTDMFVSVFNDAFTEYVYNAELAGLSHHLYSTNYGVTLSVKGYSDKQHILLKSIMEKMTHFEVDPQRFEVLKEKYVRSLKNFRAAQPYDQAIHYSSILTTECKWSKEELLEAANEITAKGLHTFVQKLLSSLYLEMLVYGNVTKEQALNLNAILENTLKSNAGTKQLQISERKRLREVQLPDQCNFLYKRENEVHKSSAVLLYYQCGRQNTRDNMLLELFCQIIKEPCFDQLRTKEQLGYIVRSDARRDCGGCQGLRVYVQSEREPGYVEGRAESFLLSMLSQIEEMSDSTFTDHINALATKRLEKPKKMKTQHSQYWNEIDCKQYNFDRDEIEVADLKTLTKSDILKFYRSLVAADATCRRKLTVHVRSTQCDQADKDAQKGTETETTKAAEPVADPSVGRVLVEAVDSFKKSLPGLYALPEPFIKIGS